jgi:protocatechuate 3,4-dioxygenase beta subunit
MTTTLDDHDDDHDRGLVFDRRRLLSLLAAGAGAAILAACDSDGSGGEATATSGAASSSTSGSSSTSASSATSMATACALIPEETAGPFPGDGSNGPDVLAESGVVRSDIRSSIGSASGVADGIPLTMDLTVVDTAADCAPLAGAAVYVWHCDREGRYSMYSDGAEGENYLRGVQESGGDGRVTFTSIFPACYSGRWPHVHFEVYASVAEATGGGEPIATSQLALPADACDAVYATDGYDQSISNVAQLSLDSDMVFADGVDQQLATVTGDGQTGYTASLTVPV